MHQILLRDTFTYGGSEYGGPFEEELIDRVKRLVSLRNNDLRPGPFPFKLSSIRALLHCTLRTAGEMPLCLVESDGNKR